MCFRNQVQRKPLIKYWHGEALVLRCKRIFRINQRRGGLKMKTRRKIATNLAPLFLVLLLGLILGGCAEGGSESQQDFEISQIEVLNSDNIVPGFPINLIITMESIVSADNLGIEFSFIQEDAEKEEITTYHLGSYAIPFVEAGEEVYPVEMVIPSDIPAGEYKLVACTDPLDQINEANENNNVHTEAIVNVTIKSEENPDLVVQSVELDSNYFTLNITDEHDEDGIRENHLSATICLVSYGKTTTNVPLRASIETSAGFEEIMIWNSDTESYTYEITITELIVNIPKYISLDLFIPDNVAANMTNENSFVLKITGDSDNTIPEFEGAVTISDREDNNSITANVYTYSLGSYSGEGLYFQKSYSKNFHNSKFGVKVRFDASASLKGSGARADVSGSVPVTIFGHTFDFIEIDSNAHANPVIITDSSYSLNVEFVDRTIYEKKGSNGFRWSKDWSIHKEKGFSEHFWLAIVPVEVSAGAEGTLGFKIEVAIESEFNADAGPYVDVGAYASASIDLLVAEGGIRGDLSLTDMTFTGNADATLSLNDNASVLSGTLSENIGYDLEGPSGRLYIYVKYPKICYKWHVIPYPCGHHTKTYSLASWHSWWKKDTLLKEEESTTIQL
jgi:hypothetical protein